MHEHKVVFVLTFLFVLGVSDRLDEVFLQPRFTLEESEESLENARESYAILTSYRQTGEERVTNLKIFTSKVVRDIDREGMTAHLLFQNIRSYLKDNGTGDMEVSEGALVGIVDNLLRAAEVKVKAHHSASGLAPVDMGRVLSSNDTTMESLFRRELDASSVGFFFLEVFATLVGLSWGIISMIIAGQA